jgi:hypothetical protein
MFIPNIVPLNPLGSVFSNINYFGTSTPLVSDVSPLSPIIPRVINYK